MRKISHRQPVGFNPFEMDKRALNRAGKSTDVSRQALEHRRFAGGIAHQRLR
jgi:hypothetical protein